MSATVTPMTIKRASDYLGMSRFDVYTMTERGELPSAMLNGGRLVDGRDLRRIKADQLVEETPRRRDA